MRWIEQRPEAWSVRMEGYGGPAQPSPTIGQCLNGGYGWLEIECCRCKTRASMPSELQRQYSTFFKLTHPARQRFERDGWPRDGRVEA